jgi:hypothetical protein
LGLPECQIVLAGSCEATLMRVTQKRKAGRLLAACLSA